MAQPSQIVPTVTLNVSGTKQEINLRDYLNVRVAPFLKKAIHDSLETEAQYPLQWLGEHLIQQSILYEGNPDATNIRERFVYNHDMALPTQSTVATDAVPQSGSVHTQQPSSENPGTVNGTNETPTEPTQETESIAQPNTSLGADQPQLTPTHDTEMGGTS